MVFYHAKYGVCRDDGSMEQDAAIRAGDVIMGKGDVVTLEYTGTLHDARNLMLRHGISRVVIIRVDKYAVGIVTEKDIVRFLYKGTRGRRLDEIQLDEVMSKDLVTATKEDNLAACARKMINRQVSSLLIVDATMHNEWSLVGIITKTDIVKARSMRSKKFIVADLMTKNPYTVSPDDVLHEAMLLMVNRNISRVIVVKNGKPVGIVTMRDLLPVGTLENPFFNRFDQSDFKMASQPTFSQSIPSGARARLVASDVMRTDLFTITKDRDLDDAVKIMVEKRIGGLPVIEQNDEEPHKNGTLSGLITKTDIAKAIAFGQTTSETAA
jgi:CBS domain-containing protein